MNEVNQHLYDALKDHPDFQSEMSDRVFPLFAPEETPFPFCVYSIPSGVSQRSKDAREFTVAVSLFYAANCFTECCTFTDKVIEILEAKNFIFVSVIPEYDDEYNSVVSTIILTIIQT